MSLRTTPAEHDEPQKDHATRAQCVGVRPGFRSGRSKTARTAGRAAWCVSAQQMRTESCGPSSSGEMSTKKEAPSRLRAEPDHGWKTRAAAVREVSLCPSPGLPSSRNLRVLPPPAMRSSPSCISPPPEEPAKPSAEPSASAAQAASGKSGERVSSTGESGLTPGLFQVFKVAIQCAWLACHLLLSGLPRVCICGSC